MSEFLAIALKSEGDSYLEHSKTQFYFLRVVAHPFSNKGCKRGKPSLHRLEKRLVNCRHSMFGRFTDLTDLKESQATLQNDHTRILCDGESHR